MTRVDDMRKALEATIGNLTPSRAQELAKGFLEPGAAKEQVAKTAADLMEVVPAQPPAAPLRDPG